MEKNNGFSLIELLIVIAIMAILGSMGLAAYTTVRKEARDIQRKQELNQYKTALESYYANNSSYPPSSESPYEKARSTGNQGIFQTDTPFGSIYMSGKVLEGVNAAEYPYYYFSDGITYKLWGGTEIDENYEICSNGKSGNVLTENLTDSLTCDL